MSAASRLAEPLANGLLGDHFLLRQCPAKAAQSWLGYLHGRGRDVELQLTVLPEAGDEAEEIAPWSTRLIKDLLDLDSVTAADPAGDASAELSDGSKGAGDLTRVLVQIPAAGLSALAQFLRAWASLTGRTVEASIEGDPIRIRGASKGQVDQILAAWIARHPPGT